MANIELPKDAEGREIPMSTNVMYDINGKKLHITSFTYKCDVLSLWAQWKVFSPDIKSESDGMLPADSLYLTPPDSWKKLFEDLDKCIKGSSLCMYYSPSGNCSCCTIFGDHSEGCDARALRTIKDRIRKLRGDGDA